MSLILFARTEATDKHEQEVVKVFRKSEVTSDSLMGKTVLGVYDQVECTNKERN